ncbi:MAG: phosphoglycerate kinase [Dehalococcoidia bacterium]|nr:MAG: phosphoglycerate kinase [Dehalococcoidia bacterium]
MDKMTVRDIEVSNKRVLVRVDFNVPLNEGTGVIADDSRIRAVLPTIKYLIDRGAKVILCSHLGRPQGKVIDKLRLAVVAQRLSQILGQPVKVTKDSIGSDVEKVAEKSKNGDVLLLENVRFHPEEEKNEASFAQALARLADIYVNDAFGAAHRSHASTVGVTKYLPAVAGLLLEKEIKALGSILKNPVHPFAALLGGAKISDKVSMIENIIGKVDYILIGGGMAATFLKAKSYEVGLSLVEQDMVDLAAKLREDTAKRGVRLILPVDVVVADGLSSEAKVNTVSIENISPHLRIVDIGPRTIKNFSEELQRCKTVFWNGPMGIYEIPQFAKGTQAIAELLANLDATTVIGGGSMAEIVTKSGLADKMTFVSTGGGASLKFLAGKALPGVEALLNKGS